MSDISQAPGVATVVFAVGGLGVFVAGSLAGAVASSHPQRIAGRIVRGLGASAAFMLARAIVRVSR